MREKKIHVLGEEEVVLMLNLLGLDGTVMKEESDFLSIFENLIKRQDIGMILIVMDLSDNLVEYLIDFKLNNKEPFIFHLPDFFQPNINKRDVFFNKIKDSIGKIIN
ncbi:MAG: V-type ATP synthase subunit F [Promethearchaeia archaeon]